ncbi:MAG: RusA family crossover junction endodeoxyribonuclease [Thaumarchaeota archaeon]|nr:RusA family crossover junction endodeoxyribonuclease [Nitrososphaerota archaeon]
MAQNTSAANILNGRRIGFIVKGKPASSQNSGSKKRSWKLKVSEAAQPLFQSPLADEDLVVRVTVFYDGIPDYDTDNVSKPVIDALKGVAYADDRQITDRNVRKRSLDNPYRIRGVSSLLVTAIADGEEFVFIEISKLGEQVKDLL